jgi:hypothetical protein
MTVSPAREGAWGEERVRRMLAEAGFAELEVRRLPHDALCQYYVARTR